ncbi:hypothetical protein A2716_00025 [candidate division WWE3 bacterium RIFCSPHIGHO2_01_FULL_40_23]|nr:MAG: hypothetical protein A2716_00025 [candidate division WWE3 bacterium RIFCSPHIGHO2_01_FULL_40_23]
MIHLVTKDVGFIKLKDKWLNTKQDIIFSSFTWNLNSWKYLKSPKDKLSIAMYTNKNLWLIFPFKTSSFYNKIITQPISSIYLSDYTLPAKSSDIIEDIEYETALKAVLEEYLKTAHHISIPNVPSDSALYKSLSSKLITENFIIRHISEVDSPKIALESFELKDLDRKFRNNILRCDRRLKPYVFEYVNNFKPFVTLLDRLFLLNKTWWEEKNSYGFTYSNKEAGFLRDTLIQLFKEHRLLCSVIKKEGIPISIGIAFDNGTAASYYVFGHDKNYRSVGIGSLHIYNFLISHHDKYLILDCMRGGYNHKYKFLAKPSISKTLRVYKK